MTREFQQMLQLAALGATSHPIDVDFTDIDWKKVIDITKSSAVCEYAIVEYESNDALTNVEKCAKALIELGIKD